MRHVIFLALMTLLALPAQAQTPPIPAPMQFGVTSRQVPIYAQTVPSWIDSVAITAGGYTNYTLPTSQGFTTLCLTPTSAAIAFVVKANVTSGSVLADTVGTTNGDEWDQGPICYNIKDSSLQKLRFYSATAGKVRLSYWK